MGVTTEAATDDETREAANEADADPGQGGDTDVPAGLSRDAQADASGRAGAAAGSRTAAESARIEKSDPDSGRTRTVPAKEAALRTTGADRAIDVPVDSGSEAPETEPVKDNGGTAVLPGFSAPSRPAWTPMTVAPRAGKKGLTVFGTTLTRTQTLVAGIVVLAVLTLLVVLIPKAFGGDGDDNQAAPTPAAAPTTTGATPAPAGAPPSDANSAPASSAPAPSTPPSSAPASSAGGAQSVTLPAGWVLYKDPTGFQVPIWDGATITRQGSEVYFRKDNRLLIVDQTDQPKPDPVADWTQQEHDRAGSAYRNYRRIKLAAVNYFVKAADWEFTYTTSNGNDQHAVKRGVITGAHQAYGLSWYTSPGDWDAGQKDLQLIYQGFQPRS